MRKFLLMCFLLILTMPLIAEELSDFVVDHYSAQLVSSDKSGLVIDFTTPDFNIKIQTLNGQVYHQITLPGWGTIGETGKPELPVLAKIIALPDDKGIESNLEILENYTIPNILIKPLQPWESDNLSLPKPDFTQDGEFYAKDTYYPANNIHISDPVIMRDLRMAQVTFCPFRYNPLKRELQVAKRMRLRVNFTSSNVVNPKVHHHSKVSSSFAQLYRAIALNYKDIITDEPTTQGGYIFVVPNTTIANAIQTLVDWKKEKGFPVDVVKTSDIGTSLSNIYNYIYNAYYNWEIPPDYVVLVGDVDGSIQIVTDHYNCGPGDNAVTDHYYAKLEGSDYFPDVMVGRLSVRSTTEVMIVVNKIIYYETNPLMTTEWFTRSLMIADYSNISCKQVKQYAKLECLDNGYTQVDTIWFNWNVSTTAVNNSINNGVQMVNFRGYLGWGGYGTGNITSLTNFYKLPVVNGCTCETGSFEITTCISEGFLRAGSPTSPTGGMGCVGPSSWNTHTKWNNCLDQGFVWGMLGDDLEHWMEFVNRGKLELWNCFPFNHGSGSTSNSVECYYHIYNLIGDPGLSVWTAHPADFSLTIPGNVPLGTNYYPITVRDSNDNPIQNAYVNLWKGTEVYVGGFTDESGSINLPISPLTAGAMKVCVSKQNFKPFRQTVQITSGSLFIGVNDTLIDDDSIPPSSGNGDGILNPGETIALQVQLKNFGTENVTGVSAQLENTDPYINLLTSTASYGNLNAGAVAWAQAPFVFSISPQCPHNHYFEISLTVTDNLLREWNSMLMFNVESADFIVRTLSLPQAGANNLLDPGETSQLIVNIENIGAYTSQTLTGIISTASSALNILDNQGTFNPILPGVIGNNDADRFQLSALANVFPGAKATLTLSLSGANGFVDTMQFEMNLGIPDANDPMVPDSYGYYCYDDADIGYIPTPTYQWVEVSSLTPFLNLPDYGNEEDCSIVVHFPVGFNFQYYGQEFDDITVCSNGWASLGSTYMSNFRNWPITAAEVAPACLAAFWDDLRLNSTPGNPNGKVYAYFDAVNHRYIIEWKQVSNADAGMATETFEIILYDPLFYPTPTGDGIIDFQYQTVLNTGNENNATVGIATPDNGDGVQYTYANIYPPGATTLHNDMAIRFTTQTNEGFLPPVIGVTPTSLEIEVPENGTGTEQLTISNTGGSSLIFNITYSDAFGGPDNFGYSWIDSDDPAGPTYNWKDISGIGTSITFVHNDSTAADMPIGFDFPFYGAVYDSFILSANGFLSFTAHANPAAVNTGLPNPTAPPNLVAPFWDDLDPLQTGASVKTWNNGIDTLIISFLSVPHWGTSVIGTYTFQMILTATGDITYQYQTLVGNYQSCTIGTQNSDGSDGLEIAYNETYLHNNLAIKVQYPFLRMEPSNGSVPPGSSQTVLVIASGYGLEPGNYDADLQITCNDPVTPQVTIPVSVIVGGGTPLPLELIVEPINPPIIIPAIGGSFNYTVSLTNISSTVQQCDFWSMALLPNGSPYGPILLRQNLSLNPGVTLTRTMTQFVPGGAPAGQYYYYGNAGDYPDSVIVTDGFNFTKSGVDLGSTFTNWSIYGWEGESVALPLEIAFLGAKPNPFNPTTEVEFVLPSQMKVEIAVYDILGRKAEVLQDGVISAGTHSIMWDARYFASGVYFLHFQAGDFRASEKILLVK